MRTTLITLSLSAVAAQTFCENFDFASSNGARSLTWVDNTGTAGTAPSPFGSLVSTGTGGDVFPSGSIRFGNVATSATSLSSIDMIVTLDQTAKAWGTSVNVNYISPPLPQSAPGQWSGGVFFTGYVALNMGLAPSTCPTGAILSSSATCADGSAPILSGSQFKVQFVVAGTNTPYTTSPLEVTFFDLDGDSVGASPGNQLFEAVSVWEQSTAPILAPSATTLTTSTLPGTALSKAQSTVATNAATNFGLAALPVDAANLPYAVTFSTNALSELTLLFGFQSATTLNINRGITFSIAAKSVGALSQCPQPTNAPTAAPAAAPTAAPTPTPAVVGAAPTAPSTPATPTSTVAARNDPHLHLAHGGRADFRGEDGAIFNFLSAKNVSFNVKTEKADFLWKQRLVHGTRLSAAYWSILGKDGKTVTVAFEAKNGSAAALTAPIIIRDAEGVVTFQKQLTFGENLVTNGGAQIALKERKLTVVANGWSVSAEVHTFPYAAQNPGKVLLNIEAKALYDADADPVAPHGLFGQSYDGDGIAVDGATDHATMKGAEATTKAQAEGAIEGTMHDYRMASPFATDFKFSRFHAVAAAHRDVSKLAGKKTHVASRPSMVEATHPEPVA